MTFASTTPKPSSSVPSRPALSPREIRLGQSLLIAFVLLVSLPYLWCALITPPGMTWGGLFFSADDQNVHLMWAKQAQNGSLFIRDLFTTEGLVSGARPLFFNLFTLALGWFSRLTGLDVMFGYHIARVAFAGLFVHQLHRLLVAATDGAPDKENSRLGALALAVFTTGAGFLMTAFPGIGQHLIFLDADPNPYFVTVPEAFALLSALIYPLNIAAFALLCFLLRCLIENRQPFKAFVAALVLSNIHTYDALPLGVACLVGLGWSLARRENVKALLPVWSAVVVGLALPVAYQIIVFRGSEEFRVKALTHTSPPAIWHVLSTFAPLFILGALGWRARWTGGTRKWLCLYGLSLLLLVYAPKPMSALINALFVNRDGNAPFYLFSFSRKMFEGLQIPLLVFAGAGLAALPRRRLAVPVIVGVCALSPLIFYKWMFQNAAQNNPGRGLMPPYYLSNADAGALLKLKGVPDKNVAVLCLPFLGSYVPRATGLTTFTGHWAETLNLNFKLGQERAFYRGEMTPAQARTFLKQNRIAYVIESPYERAFAPNASVAQALGLKPIYSANSPDGETVVFQVSP